MLPFSAPDHAFPVDHCARADLPIRFRDHTHTNRRLRASRYREVQSPVQVCHRVRGSLEGPSENRISDDTIVMDETL